MRRLGPARRRRSATPAAAAPVPKVTREDGVGNSPPETPLIASTTAFATTNQVTGTNYSSGGGTLTNVTPSTSGTTAICDFADFTFSTATVTARGCLLYNSTNSNKALCAIDFGGDKTSTAGDFTIVFPSPTATGAIIRLA